MRDLSLAVRVATTAVVLPVARSMPRHGATGRNDLRRWGLHDSGTDLDHSVRPILVGDNGHIWCEIGRKAPNVSNRQPLTASAFAVGIQAHSNGAVRPALRVLCGRNDNKFRPLI